MKTKFLPALYGAVLACYAINGHAQANQSLSNLTAPTTVNKDLKPDANNAKDLGGALISWRNIYLTNGLHIWGNLALHASGLSNFFVGSLAGNTSLTGAYNTGMGRTVLRNLTSGGYNTATGFYSLYSNTTGNANTADGYQSLYNNTSGSNNTANGSNALYWNTSGDYNTASGYHALWFNTTGIKNTANGANTLQWNTTGDWNTAAGYNALYKNTSANGNTANGEESMYNNETGTYNTAIGLQSLYFNETGAYNAAIGTLAMTSNETGNYNTALGSWADVSTGNLTNATAIGYGALVDASNKVRIGNTSVTSIGGHVGWTTFSDGRYKRDIKENVIGLAFINSLRPITYTIDVNSLNEYYRKGTKQSSETKDQKINTQRELTDVASRVYDGFVAQEVEEAANKLSFKFSGLDKPQNNEGLYGLRYDNFVVPIVKAVQELSKMNDEKNEKIVALQKQNNELENRIKKLEAMMNVQADMSSQSSKAISTNSALLEQNAPNPFTHTTSIKYTIPQKFATGQILVTDKNGKMLKQVRVSGNSKTSINVDMSTFSPGVYNYSLIIDGRLISTKQMILAK